MFGVSSDIDTYPSMGSLNGGTNSDSLLITGIAFSSVEIVDSGCGISSAILLGFGVPLASGVSVDVGVGIVIADNKDVSLDGSAVVRSGLILVPVYVQFVPPKYTTSSVRG
jgi:hypothetical protein